MTQRSNSAPVFEEGNPLIGKLMLSIVFIGLALVVSGTNACQEDYEFAAQANPSGSPTASPTASGTDSPDDGITSSPTPTSSESETPTATATATATATSTPSTETAISGSVFLKSLSKLSGGSSNEAGLSSDGGGSAKSGKEGSAEGNWLGQTYSDQQEAGLDSDADGYTDALEIDFGTDPMSAESFPLAAPVTSLALRLAGSDDDIDGLTNSDEQQLGTDPFNSDSDGDGIPDGAEVLSKSNPFNPQDRPQDSDGDGLSDNYESGIGTSADSVDSDGDQLSDDAELALSCNPLDKDTDKDGILDGKEVQLQSDPIIPEGGTLD